MNEFCNNVSTLKAFCNVGWRWSPYSVKVEGARDDVPVRMRANANREIRTRSAIVWRKIRITLIDSHFSSLDHGCNTTVVAPPAHCSTTYGFFAFLRNRIYYVRVENVQKKEEEEEEKRVNSTNDAFSTTARSSYNGVQKEERRERKERREETVRFDTS